jgi:hypothetical protein
MAFVVEDGTGLSNANSYCDLTFAASYFEDRNAVTWDVLDDDIKKASLILATDYIEMRFGSQLRGVKFNLLQSLFYPATLTSGLPIDTFIYDELDPTLVLGVDIPTAIKKATCEYAIRASKNTLIKDVASDAMVSSRVKVGSIEKETNFGYNSRRADLFASYPTADLLIKPYLKSNPTQVIR